jgi:isocitrate dehydrogenase (NAD+)
MVDEGRAQYADPCSMLRASVMLLEHIGYVDKARALEKALDYCMFEDKRLVVTGRDSGATGKDFCDYVLENLK